MSKPLETHPKPRASRVRPELTRLPPLTPGRRLVRRLLHALTRLLVWLFVDARLSGGENYPLQGPVLVVSNHLGDADAIVGVAFSPRLPELLAKTELYDFPILGKLMRAYGVIWIHRGFPDRKALRAALQGLDEQRMVCLAPEGRESLNGALEEGTNGAAYLAFKSKAPVLPVTFTGTENWRIYGNLKRLRRTQVSITVGPPFHLQPADDWRAAIQQGTRRIMLTLADQLPLEYRGVYAENSQTASGGTNS
ncbi:MAG: lysophospholipid acyltransferase family protein [Chloroflexota bacterium]